MANDDAAVEDPKDDEKSRVSRRTVALESVYTAPTVALVTSILAAWLGWRLAGRSFHILVGSGIIGASLLVAFAVRGIRVLRARLRATRKKLRAKSRGLRDAASDGVRTTCIGRVRCLAPVNAPHTGKPCAAYITRSPIRAECEIESQAGAIELETSDGAVALGEGKWNVADPFDGRTAFAEARIDEGLEVAVRARVEACMAPGEGYRGGKETFRLRAGGKITPLGMVFSARMIRQANTWLAVTVGVSFFVSFSFWMATAVDSSDLRASSSSEIRDPAPASSPVVACGDRGECADSLVCDGERWTCVPLVKGRLSAGQECKTGECGSGLRCRTDLMADASFENLPRKCTASCTRDADCPTGEWCLPCMNKPLKTRGDCVEPSRLKGAVGVVCEALHAMEKGSESPMLAPSARASAKPR